MSKETALKTAQEVLENGEGMARNIWLAGLGVYSRSLEEAQQLNNKTSQLFDELVEKGREVENATKQRADELKAKTEDSVEARVNGLFQRLGGVDRRRLDQMDEKLDKLTEALDKLAEAK